MGAFFILDEQRLVGSGEWTKSFLKIAKANNWILLSATPGDTWMDYIPVFVANGFYKNRTEFKREHVVYNTFSKFPKVDRYINQGKLVRHRANVLVEMPYERHTKRRPVEVMLPYDKEQLEAVLKKRWHVFEDRPLRDIAEMCSVARRVVNGDPSRLEMVCNLWTVHPKLIIFYNFNYELESLRSLKDYYGISSIDTSTGSKKTLQTPSTTTTVSNGSAGIWTPTSSQAATSMSSAGLSQNGFVEGAPRAGERGRKKISENIVRSLDVPATGVISGRKDGSQRPSEKPSLRTNTRSSLRLDGQRKTLTPSFDEGSSNKLTTHCTTNSPMISTPPESVMISEWNGHKHQPVPTTDRWLYLVQYTAGAEGWNCITTDAMVMYSRNYSWKVTEQAYGRNDRLNTPFTDLWYYNFTSDSWIDRAIERSLKAKKTFNEAEFAGVFKE